MPKQIAILSDIHSNSLALAAVLQDISNRDIQQIVNLGDSLFGPVDPLGTAKQLMEHPNIVHIMGNCDEILLQKQSDSDTFNFIKPLLTEDIETWIGSFKNVWTYEDLLFCHGTPFVNDRYLLEEVDAHGVRYKQPEQLSSELEKVDSTYIFCGHSHVFKTMFLPNGKTVINAGSVGLPAYEDELPFPHKMESNSPYAEYVIASQTQDDKWNIEHIMLQYDWNQASAIAAANGREDYAVAIQTGRISES
ncbi:metallophosphoesterase [Saccharibacillus sp. JS10]|uniref:metallophosphoesterase family protein n=1 Tax=Saccharibacillus sp. JS10 TaxID=2950552 RepID=UPI00210D8129|nr:metallophosphoesterase family protein [Saccharibacillus sp. JS10]MCQ4086994.1 metallophosphatase family protein [Saccharibacillus sp. JS10]